MNHFIQDIGKPAFTTVAALLLLGAFFRFCLTGHGMLAYTLWAVALLILWFYLLRRISEKHGKLSTVLRRITLCCLAVFFVAFAITEAVIIANARTAEEPQAEYLVVLGAGVNGTEASWSLKDRLNVAYDYLLTYPDSVAILSGGQGEHEDITEAECMYRWLTERGIDPRRLIKEEEAARTIENLENSFAIIRQREGERPVRIAVISSEYHLLRAKLLAERLGVRIVPVAAPTGSFTLRINHFIRECLGIWYYMIFDR